MRSPTMRCAARSVIPTVSPTSRKRMSGSSARQIRTCAWLVRNDQETGSSINSRLVFLDSNVIYTGRPDRKRHLMPHSKCMACKTRLYSTGAPAEMVGELCPDCGGLLEPVGSLVEVVGFRRITQRPTALEADIAAAVALPRPDARR